MGDMWLGSSGSGSCALWRLCIFFLLSPCLSLSWLLGLARMSLLESEVERTADSGQDKAVEDANCIYVFM